MRVSCDSSPASASLSGKPLRGRRRAEARDEGYCAWQIPRTCPRSTSRVAPPTANASVSMQGSLAGDLALARARDPAGGGAWLRIEGEARRPLRSCCAARSLTCVGGSRLAVPRRRHGRASAATGGRVLLQAAGPPPYGQTQGALTPLPPAVVATAELRQGRLPTLIPLSIRKGCRAVEKACWQTPAAATQCRQCGWRPCGRWGRKSRWSPQHGRYGQRTGPPWRRPR